MRVGRAIRLRLRVYDGGRTRRLVEWRTERAEAARLGQINTQEQVAASTVALALERSRYRQQAQVYAQQVRKMACLTQALESIVATDRGRASELVQARKSLQTAELAQAQAQSQLRQVEVRLRRVAGTDLPSPEGLATAVLEIPSLPTALADAALSAQIAQLSAQSAAADNLAQSVELPTRPKLGWTPAGSAADGTGGLRPPPRPAPAGCTAHPHTPPRNAGNAAARRVGPHPTPAPLAHWAEAALQGHRLKREAPEHHQHRNPRGQGEHEAALRGGRERGIAGNEGSQGSEE